MANYQLLNNVEHKDIKVVIDRSAELGDNVWYAVTFPNEFRALQRHYPVFFTKNPDSGEFRAVAMFGVEDGENLFLNENGWNATYIPLNIMRQPFLIGYQEQEAGGRVTREPVVTIDMDSPRVGTEEGEPLFLEHGGNSEYLEQINSILQMLLAGMKSCKGFFNTLEELNLLDSFVLDAQLYDGSEHRLAGFYTINEEALANLDGAELELLSKKGYLEPIYMVIASMTNLPLLLERKNQMRRAEAEHVEH